MDKCCFIMNSSSSLKKLQHICLMISRSNVQGNISQADQIHRNCYQNLNSQRVHSAGFIRRLDEKHNCINNTLRFK